MPSDMRIEISDMTWGVSSNRHVTLGHALSDMGHGSLSDN